MTFLDLRFGSAICGNETKVLFVLFFSLIKFTDLLLICSSFNPDLNEIKCSNYSALKVTTVDNPTNNGRISKISCGVINNYVSVWYYFYINALSAWPLFHQFPNEISKWLSWKENYCIYPYISLKMVQFSSGKGMVPNRRQIPCLRMADRALLAGYHRYTPEWN